MDGHYKISPEKLGATGEKSSDSFNPAPERHKIDPIPLIITIMIGIVIVALILLALNVNQLEQKDLSRRETALFWQKSIFRNLISPTVADHSSRIATMEKLMDSTKTPTANNLIALVIPDSYDDALNALSGAQTAENYPIKIGAPDTKFTENERAWKTAVAPPTPSVNKTAEEDIPFAVESPLPNAISSADHANKQMERGQLKKPEGFRSQRLPKDIARIRPLPVFSAGNFALSIQMNKELAVFADRDSKKTGLIDFSGTIRLPAMCDRIFATLSYEDKLICEAGKVFMSIDMQKGIIDFGNPTQINEVASENDQRVFLDLETNQFFINSMAGISFLDAAGQISSASLFLFQQARIVAQDEKRHAGELGRFGFVDQKLTIRIPAVFEDADEFSNGLAAVKKDGKWGYIDEKGNVVIPFQCEPFEKSVYDGTSADGINQSAIGMINHFSDGFIAVKRDGKMGIINRENQTVIPFLFDVIFESSAGNFFAVAGDEWGIISLSPLE